MKLRKPIESLILEIRHHKVLIDADLAAIYGVETRALNLAVKRNADRFPKDFIFQLTADEKLKVITNCDHFPPCVEQPWRSQIVTLNNFLAHPTP